MAVTGAVLRSAYVQFSRILSKRCIRSGVEEIGSQQRQFSQLQIQRKTPVKWLQPCSSRCYMNKPSPEVQTEWSPVTVTQNVQDVVHKIDSKLQSGDVGRLFAVVHIGGKQRKVTVEDIIIVENVFPPTVGDKIRLEKVLMAGSKDFTLLGRPILSRSQVYVEATVVEKTLSHFKTDFVYKPRKGYRRFNLKRCEQTMLVINNIAVNQISSGTQ